MTIEAIFCYNNLVMNTRIKEDRYSGITDRILNGESYAAIARDMGVSRSRIHQLAQQLNVTKSDSVLPYIEQIIERREGWETPKQIFSDYHFTQHKFERVLEEHPLLMERWEVAQELPTTRDVNNVNPEGRACISCHTFKPWSEFHRGTGPNNHSSRCKPCAIDLARASYLSRQPLTN